MLSELRKGERADVHVARWFGGLSTAEIFLSVLVLAEVRRGIESVRRRDPRKALALETWLREVLQDYEDRILPIDRAVADAWGRMNVPFLLPVIDGLMAATARVHGLTLASRNVKHLTRTGVATVNPFEPASA